MKSRLLTLALSLSAINTSAAELRGMLDLRALDSRAERSFLEGGLGKTRYDASSPVISLGQAVLRGEFDVTDSISTSMELSSDDRQHNAIDVREAWLAWNPVPSSAWKTRVKGGFFFPPTSVEIDYEGIGWTPKRTISSAAINSWIGEELRTKGFEWSTLRLGRYADATYDVGLLAAVFTGNDPTGTLLAWRGWSISDRIAGHSEALQLADLPVYRPDGAIPRQSRTIHPFREIDGRPGYYVGMRLNRQQDLVLTALHYDNRADPRIVKSGQYAWRTRFDHVSALWRPAPDWEILMQAMHGDTLMGANAVALDFRSWYLLASHPAGAGVLSVRFDRFSTSGHDILPADRNDETGYALALAYSMPLSDTFTLLLESLAVQSQRSSRQLIGEPIQQTGRTLMASLRWSF